jgi:enamine deaminase RidA (YjgF/YER057c/UK114 family)
MSLKQPIHPEGIAKPSGVWTPAVVAKPGRLVFLSGFTSRDPQGNVHGVGDIKAQTRRVCELLQISVRAAGGELSDLMRVDVYVRDMNHFKDIHAVRREFFPKDPPASTMVEVSRLVDERSLIEISAIAVIP